MKPWENTWKSFGSPVGLGLVIDDKGNGICGVEDTSTAALIAAAPEMARALLSLEWAMSDEGDYCPSCQANRPHNPRFKEDLRQPYYLETPGVGHRDDCVWLAALRKAGVTP